MSKIDLITPEMFQFATPLQLEKIKCYIEQGSIRLAAKKLGLKSPASIIDAVNKVLYKANSTTLYNGPKVLVFDIETTANICEAWGLWNQNISLNMILREWGVISWSAKWLGKKNVMYMDIRDKYNGSAKSILQEVQDKKLLKQIWKLLDKADIVITQNGKKFDVKKLNARFIMHGFQPPSSYKHIDTLQIAKAKFAFTSNKLEWMTNKLCSKYKKLKHGKLPGFQLWRECLLGNKNAWEEMEKYNRYDVLSLEEVYSVLAPWDNRLPNFNLYKNSTEIVCNCGSTDFKKYGFAYTAVSKFQRYKCKSCGGETRGRENLFTKEKRKSLRTNVAG